MQNTCFLTTGLVCLVVLASLFTGCYGGNNPPMAAYQTPQPAVANPPGTGVQQPLVSAEQCALLKKQLESASYAENNGAQKFIDSTRPGGSEGQFFGQVGGALFVSRCDETK